MATMQPVPDVGDPSTVWRCSNCGTPNGECSCGCGGGKRGRQYTCPYCSTESHGSYCFTCKTPRETTFEGLEAARREIQGKG